MDDTPTTSHVHYRRRPRNYLLELARPFRIRTGIVRPGAPLIGNAFVNLDQAGVLSIAAEYAWDGASGPIAQTPDVIRPSVVHDALYQLMREFGLEPKWRVVADQLLRQMCVADGMPRWQANVVHAAVATFGARYIDPLTPQPVLIAPVPVTYPSSSDWSAP